MNRQGVRTDKPSDMENDANNYAKEIGSSLSTGATVAVLSCLTFKMRKIVKALPGLEI